MSPLSLGTIVSSTETEDVAIFGTIQTWPKVHITFTELLKQSVESKGAERISLNDGQSREAMSLKIAAERALAWELRSRCKLKQTKPVVCVRAPSSLTGMIAYLAVLLSRCVLVPISWDITDPSEIERILSVSGASVYISTREALWESEYTLTRLRIGGACIGGEGPLAQGCVDLLSNIDPRMDRFPIPLVGPSLEDPCVFVLDEQTKELYEFTERAILITVLGNMKHETANWQERVIPKLNALLCVTEILPRLVCHLVVPSQNGSSISDGMNEGDISVESDDAIIMVFDNLYGTRIRRAMRVPWRNNHVGPARTVEAEKRRDDNEHKPSIIASLMLSVTSNISGEHGPIGIKLGLTRPPSSAIQVRDLEPGISGFLSVSGPSLFRQILGSVSRTVESFRVDGDGTLWFVSRDQVHMSTNGVTFVLNANSPRAASVHKPSGDLDWKRRLSPARPRPPPRIDEVAEDKQQSRL